MLHDLFSTYRDIISFTILLPALAIDLVLIVKIADRAQRMSNHVKYGGSTSLAISRIKSHRAHIARYVALIGVVTIVAAIPALALR